MSVLVLCSTKNANSMHILVIVETLINNALVNSFTEYQHGWSKFLDIQFVSEARFFERQTVRILMNLCTKSIF